MTHTSKSYKLYYLHNCFIFIAADNPDGPPPTIRTSYSSFSLSSTENFLVCYTTIFNYVFLIFEYFKAFEKVLNEFFNILIM